MKKILSGALAGTLLALLPGTALAGPTVTVRVEGDTATLLERTTVTLPDAAPPVAGCPASSAAAALEEATRGDWDRQAFTQTILGESHTFANSDYWAEWVDRGAGYVAGAGVCNDVLEEGDELLMLVDRSPAGVPTRFPVALEGLPATVAAGTAVPVTVAEFRSDLTPGTGTRTPVAGATVAGGGATATTAADGTATLTLVQPGTVTVKATAPSGIPSAAQTITVTAAPAPPPGGGGPAPAPSPAAGAPEDITAPRPAIARLRAGAVYRARRAPRLIRGTVAEDGAGLRTVQLSIVRQRRGRCAGWSARRERFRRKACDGPASFTVGTTARWSYQLPARLGPGRYYIRVTAVDAAGNRASTRVVIRVR